MRVVFFLGAGFSKPAGFPLMREFRSFAQNLPGYEEEKRCLWGAIQYTQRACAYIQGDIYNIEDIMSALSLTHAIDRKRILIFEGKPVKAEDAAEHLATLVWRTYLRIHDAHALHRTYAKLFRAVRLFRRDPVNRLDIVTTNYDMLPEILLSATGDGPAAPAGPEMRIADASDGTNGSIYAGPGEQILHKLHGSVNWFRRRGKAPEVYYDDRVGKQIDVGVPAQPCPVSWCAEHGEKLPEKFRPLIAPPSFLKTYKPGVIQTAWNGAEEAIRKANRLIFIGYSFPPSDTIMRFFLGNALAGNRPGCAITVIDRNTKAVMNSLRTILVRSITDHYVDTIEADIEEMIGKQGIFENQHEFANYLRDMTRKAGHLKPRRQ